ncbi:sodium/glutamate symporter [Steroidobacter flavus]|uniref:Sodium/glutamate symporter n=1 Tax=Steroidobacter flavus TaxID=1842136 RepID=A0ABV8T2H7_9GAMM
MKLGLIETAAVASMLLLAGYAIRRIVTPLERVNMPAPVIGGLIAAVGMLIARILELPTIEFDTSPQQPLMIAFFTSLGFAASVRLLRAGGLQVLVLLALCSVFAVLQNLLGIGIATAFGLNPLFGVITGSVTLTGGPATGLAFAPLFEQAGVTGASTVAITTAMAGIILGSLVGAPLATALIERRGLKTPTVARSSSVIVDVQEASDPQDEGARVLRVLKTIAIFLIAMWLGSWISAAIQRTGLTMPAYIGAMLAASALRNFDDVTGWLKLPHRYIDMAGAVTLSLFLVMAMMTLDLLKLSSLAGPLLVVIAAQLLLVMLAFVWPLYQWMGRDYEAAVISGGFAGFMLGTTANAMAVMRSLVERYGPAPRAFLVAPLVGAFFMDFTNALIITLFLNLLA